MEAKSAAMPEISRHTLSKEAKQENRGAGVAWSWGWKGAASWGPAGLSALGFLGTKAGLLALGLSGTAVAVGVGVAGLNVLGPHGSGGGLQSIFALRAKEPAVEQSADPGAGDGTSRSLQYLQDANAGGEGPGQGAEAAPADDARASLPPESSAAPVGTSAPLSASAPAATQRLPALAKGGLTSLSGSASAGRSSADAVLSVPARGKASGALARFGGSISRLGAVAPRAAGPRQGLAFPQLAAVRRDHARADSSPRAGCTYDGCGSGIFGTEGGAPAGQGQRGPADSSPPPTRGSITVVDEKPRQPPPPGPARDVTPFKKALQKVQTLILVAAGLMLIAGKIMDGSIFFLNPANALVVAFARFLALAALLMALSAVLMGAYIAAAPYGQRIAGAIVVLMGGLVAYHAWQFLKATANSGAISSNLESMDLIARASGALVLVGMVGLYLAKPKQYPETKFRGGEAPDFGMSAPARLPDPPGRIPGPLKMDFDEGIISVNYTQTS